MWVLPLPESPCVIRSSGRRGAMSARASAKYGLARASTCCESRLPRFDREHLCANHRAVGEIETQHLDAGVVAARFEVLAEERVCEIGPSVREQVHCREARFADHVDLAQPNIEFEGVERDDLAVEEQQVLQMQVAVALLACGAREPGCDG